MWNLALLVLGGAALLLLYILESWTVATADPDAPTPREQAEHPTFVEPTAVPSELHAASASDSTAAKATNDSPPATVAKETGSPGAHLHGRVVDDRTEEPVPELTVTLSCGGRSEKSTTGIDGGFQAADVLPAGDLVVEIADLDTLVGGLEQKVDSGQTSDLGTIRVRLGPTIPLLVEPAGAKVCTARLVESARPSGVAGVIDVRNENLEARTTPEGVGDRDWPWMHVRAGTLPWIRYPRIFWIPDDRRLPHVEVRLCESGSEGVGAIASTVGIQPPVKTRPSVEYGAVSGALLLAGNLHWNPSHAGNPGVSVLLLPPKEGSASSRGTPMWYEARPDSTGAFVFPRVKPGTWRLVAQATDHKVARLDLNVPAGRTELPPIRMVPSESEAFFDLVRPGVDIGNGHGRTAVRLRLAEAGSFARAWLTIDPPEFSDLPAAEFDMTMIGLERLPVFRPFVGRVSTPPEELNLHDVQTSETSKFGFDVRDARTDQRLDGWIVSFGPQGAMLGCTNGSEDGGWRIARDAPLAWSIWKQGYAPAFGDERSFHDSDLGRTARADLTPGWGASLLFRAGDPGSFQADPWPWDGWTFPNAASLVGALAGPPLRDVRVEVAELGADGFATSDEEGEAHLQLGATPSRLTLRCAGWKLLGVQLLARADVRQYVVWMDRE
ncbi:MAG TPA: hypothetical protein VGR31_17310 [Planctomycetota bacterium]|nr:hypothetical protein [Planctomycetota bacterium]